MPRGPFALCLLALLPLSSALLRPAHEPQGSFLTADEKICIETRQSGLSFVMRSLHDSPLHGLTADSQPIVESCFNQGYTKVFSTLEPCFKETTLWKYDPAKAEFQGEEGKLRLQQYTKKVRGLEEALLSKCFGKNQLAAKSAMMLNQNKAKTMELKLARALMKH